MKSMLLVGVLIVSVISAVGQNNVTTIEGFSGMAGCWERKDDAKKSLISEQWMKPAGTSIFGVGRTVKNSTTTGWEFMRIEKREDGIYFVSRPKENVEDTAFKMISSTAGEFVFENREHDFPQRVIYRLKGTAMTGRVEGNNNGKFLGIDFPMARVPCT